MATLCGLVATGVALLAFGQLMTFAEPAEVEEELMPIESEQLQEATLIDISIVG
jgi:hypothetical protein